jgi:hypothetical protein
MMPDSSKEDLRTFLSSLTGYQLKSIPREAYRQSGVHIRGYSRMKRADLIEAIGKRYKGEPALASLVDGLRADTEPPEGHFLDHTWMNF